MSTVSDILRSIERQAERAIAQELHLMIEQVLQLRTCLDLEERNHADGLLLKLDCLRNDRLPIPCQTPPMPPVRPPGSFPAIDELVALSPGSYEVRFFDRDYGDLEDVAVVESFPLAVQLAVDRHKALSDDLTEATWNDGRGMLIVRTRHGTVLLRIEAIEAPMPAVQPHVARACIALEHADPAPARQLFTALRQAA